MYALSARIRRGLDRVGRPQAIEQRLRLSDLWHFGRRRETFERGPEDGLGFDETAGRMVELGEGKGREKFVAACALSLRDGDRGSICVFGGADVRGIAFEQNVAAKAMQEGEGCKVCGLIRADQRFIDACDRAVRPQLRGFEPLTSAVQVPARFTAPPLPVLQGLLSKKARRWIPP